MKNAKTLAAGLLGGSLTAVMMVAGLLVSSCTKTETNKPAPTVTVTPATASNTAGSAVTTAIAVDSPEGGSMLKILVNGAASADLPDQTLDGSPSQTVNISYTIPATASVGATYVVTFQALDKKNQQSNVGTFTATVSAVPAKTIVEVTGNITSNTTWTKDKIYRLNGFVRVGKDEKPSSGTVAPVISATAVLTIEAGTVIYGKTGTPGGTLIVQRGSQIQAVGTSTAPIIFTSEKSPGTKKSGDWGGVVLCGKAKNNFTSANGLLSSSTGTDMIEELEGGYGGFIGGGASAADNDNSGTLKYVRIEYAGYPINPNQEINGLTLGSIGSGTTLSYIQVTYANDDSYEWFGGAVNADHLIAYKGIDDDFDTDNGFSGKVQFGLGIRDSNIADQSGSNGFESDNNAIGAQTDSNAPVTVAQFSNMTIIGGKATSGTTIDLQFQNGAQIRRNSAMGLFNSIVTGYPNGVFIDGGLPAATPTGSGGTVAKASANQVPIKNNIFAGVDGWGGNGYGSASTADETSAVTGLPFGANANHPNAPRGRICPAGAGGFTNGVFGYNSGASEQQLNSMAPVAWLKATNTMMAKWTDSGLSATIFEPLNGAPTLIPTASSPLTSGADFTGLSGFQTVTYRGAFGTTDWTSGWVNWNPGITDYSK